MTVVRMYITYALIHMIFVVSYTCRYGGIFLVYTYGVEGIECMMMCHVLTLGYDDTGKVQSHGELMRFITRVYS
ncbi:hypothetical protein Hanom_Chr10g00895241 [Helianthus anomalus]